MTRLLVAALAVTLALPAHADDVTDTIESALQAYGEGDLAYAEEELNFALQLLKQIKAASLADYLPAAMSGWTREADPGAAQAYLAMGGSAAAANYSDGSDRFSLTIVADSPMVASMAAMISNPAIAASSGGKLIRVGREKFLQQDQQIMGLIDKRVLIQADGSNAEAILAHLETMDFEALGGFGN